MLGFFLPERENLNFPLKFKEKCLSFGVQVHAIYQSGVFRITHFHTLSRHTAICHNGGQKGVQSARKVEEIHNVNVIMYLNLHSICN